MTTLVKKIFGRSNMEPEGAVSAEEEVATMPVKGKDEAKPKEDEEAPKFDEGRPKEDEESPKDDEAAPKLDDAEPKEGEAAPEEDDETSPEGETPQAAPETETKDQSMLVKEAHDALVAWHELHKVEKTKAEDAYYYSEELWCEDKGKWASGKRKVLKGEWTVEKFDEEVQKLKKKQQPMWSILLENVKQIRERLEGPHENVTASHDLIKANLSREPTFKLFKKDTRTPDEKELYNEYHYKLRQEFDDAEMEFQLLFAWPEGTLTRVRLFWEHSLKEGSNLVEYIHDLDAKKKLSHEPKDSTPEQVASVDTKAAAPAKEGRFKNLHFKKGIFKQKEAADDSGAPVVTE